MKNRKKQSGFFLLTKYGYARPHKHNENTKLNDGFSGITFGSIQGFQLGVSRDLKVKSKFQNVVTSRIVGVERTVVL